MVASEQSSNESPKRVVIVTQPYWPDIQSTSHLLTELLDSLDESGIAFNVVCAYPAVFAEGEGGRRSVPSRERRGQTVIYRCGWQGNSRRSIAHRLWGMASFVLSATWRVIRLSRGAMVCTLTNPPFAPLWIASLAVLFRFPYQIICHDVYPDGLVALGKLRVHGWVARLWSAANRRAWHRAECIVVLGRDMLELLRDRYQIDEEKLVLIPHWSVNDSGGRMEASATETWRTLGYSEETFVVQYSGNMGLWHDMKTLVRAAAELKEEEKIRFLFIGEGMRRSAAQSLAEELGATNITWLPFQPEEQLTDSLAACSVALVSQRKGLQGAAVPCKLYGILASGRCIIGMVPPDCEVARVIAEENCGWQLAPGDVNGLVRLVKEMTQREEEVRQKGANAYRAFDIRYRLHHAASQYLRLWGEGTDSTSSDSLDDS